MGLGAGSGAPGREIGVLEYSGRNLGPHILVQTLHYSEDLYDFRTVRGFKSGCEANNLIGRSSRGRRI